MFNERERILFMKFWTIQTREVLEMIQKDGVYQPDFSKSRYLNENEALNDLYYFILQAFNSQNQKNLRGLIFAFARSDDRSIYPIGTIEEFYSFMQSKKAVLGGFLKNIDKNNSVIMELNYTESFNPIFIDINDFQFLMPPIMLLPPYTKESLLRIQRNIIQGQITVSEFPSNVIQAHLPYIKKENIVNAYQMFDVEL